MADNRDALAGASATLNQLIDMRLRTLALDLRVSLPAHVLTYDPTLQRAHLQCGLLPVRYIGDDEIVQAPIEIPGVPVEWVGGSQGYVTTPLLPGDTGRVTFMDRAMAQWLLLGIPTDPVNGRTHNLGDAVFTPGLRNITNPITPPTALDATVLHGVARINLGRAATHPVVWGDQLHTYLIAMFTAAATAALDGGATFKANLIAYLGANPLTAYTSAKTFTE